MGPDMGQDHALLSTVSALYDAVLEPHGWNRTLQKLAVVARSSDAGLMIERPGAASYAAGNFDADHNARLQVAAAAGEMPPWRSALPVGQVLRSSDMLPDHEFARTFFYNEVIRPRGAFYAQVAALLRGPQLTAYLTIGRDLGREDFDANDMSAMQALVPHLVTAIQIQNRIRTSELRAVNSHAALDQLDVGVILVDEAIKPVLVNARASALLAQHNGLRLQQDGIAAALPGETAVLRRALAAAIDLSGRSPDVASVVTHGMINRLLISRPPPRLPLRARIMPINIPADWLVARARAGLFVTDPDPVEKTETLQCALQARFQLTPAEAALATEIMKGDGRQAAAQRRGISVGTARAHLSGIFAKTGVHRQAELVRLLKDMDNGNGR